jgi:hypothetical protein
MAMTEEKRAKFEAGLEALSDEDIRLNLDTEVYGPKWRRSLAEQELERRAAPAATATDRWFSKSNIMAGIYVLAAIAAAGFFAWFFGG